MYQVYQKPLSGTSIGVVFGTFAPLHQGHLDMIFRAKKENDGGVLVICCGNDDDDKGCEVGLTLTKRYRYMREFFKDDDLVSVHAIDEIGANTYSFENWEPWLERFNDIWKVAVKTAFTKEVWYVGEKQYHDDLVKLGKEVVLLDRTENPISGTMIRNNPIKYWNKIALPFRREFTHKILIVGTASEGKSTLVQDLAKYFSTSHAHEWPRDYIDKHSIADWEFDGNTFLTFLVGQREHILDQISSPMNNGVFFCDTDASITSMYAEYYAGDPDCAMDWHSFDRTVFGAAYQIAKSTKWDKVYVLEPNGKFVDDNVRFMKHSGMDDRKYMLNVLFQTLKAFGLYDKIELLPGGDYKGNFETIKKYAEEIYKNAYVD